MSAAFPAIPPVPDGVATPAGAVCAAASPVAVALHAASDGASIPVTVYGTALSPGFAALWQVAIGVPAAIPEGDYFIDVMAGGVWRPVLARLTIER